MALIDYVKQIFDMANPMPEANIKLKHTLCLVNGELVWVHSLDEKTNTIMTISREQEVKKIKVDTFYPFLPEAGLYCLNNGTVIQITRNPQKQYTKSWTEKSHKLSFCYGKDNYFVPPPRMEPQSITLQQIVGQKTRDILVDLDRVIWFWDIPVGYIKNSREIVCTNSNFTQELYDWSRDA